MAKLSCFGAAGGCIVLPCKSPWLDTWNGRNVDSDRESTSMPLHDTFTVSLSCPGLLPHPLSCSINVSDYEDNVLYSAGYFWCYCAVAIGRFLKFMPRFYDM